MFRFNEKVNVKDIWQGAEDHKDQGEVKGLLRGYNIEVTNHSGNTYWDSCSYIYGSIEDYFNDDFHKFYFKERGVVPTGRYCFRGYGKEVWDEEEREHFVETLSDEEVKAII